MAVYRGTGRRRGTTGALLLGAVLVLAVVALVWWLGRPAPADDLTQAKAGLTEAAGRLDLLAVEYPKQAAGQPNGAGAALRAARSAFDQAAPALTRLDPAAEQQQAAALAHVEQLVAANAPPADVTAAAGTLEQQLGAWVATH